MADIWYMDSEFCCCCGALLDFWESDVCFDCREDDEDEQPTIGTPEEAYAVALSLVDEEQEELP